MHEGTPAMHDGTRRELFYEAAQRAIWRSFAGVPLGVLGIQTYFRYLKLKH